MKDIFKKTKDKIISLNEKYNSFIIKKPLFYVTQFFPKNILLLILFIVVISLSFTKIKTNDVLMVASNYDSFADEIVDKSLIQKIDTKNVNRFNKIGIIFGTYNRKNTSNYSFILYKNDKVIDKKDFNSGNIEDVKTYYFKYKTIKVNKKDNYKFEIKPVDASKGNALTVTMDKNSGNIHYELRALSEFNIYFMIGIFVIVFMLINYLVNNDKIKSYKKFYILMLIYLIPTMLLTPPLQSPDETYHFSKAYSLSQYNFKLSPYKNSKKNINYPKNIDCIYYSRYSTEKESNLYSENVSEKKNLFNCFKNEKNIKRKSLEKNNYSKILSTIFPTIGIKIADIFSNSPIIIFYMGRLFNFLLSFLIILYSLKILKNKHDIVMLVVMIPMLIYQMVSYSYDGLLNALCILVSCYLINFFTSDDKIQKKELIIYSIASIIIFSIKAPYVLIPLLIIFVDNNKLFNKKYKKFLLAALLLLISYFVNKWFEILPNIGKVNEIKKTVSSSSKTPADNLNYLINNPIHVLRVAKNTIILRGKWYLVTMIGSLGWLRYLFNESITYIYLCALFITTLSNSLKMIFKKRIAGIFVLLVLIAGIFLSMYISWSPYGLNYVEGVQGRYFIPLIIPFLLFIIPNKKIIRINDYFIMSFINIIQLYSIIMIVISFY